MMELPTISKMRLITQSLATLDAILMPEWQDRYYSFNSRWSDDAQKASMRNGSGDEWFALFHQAGWAGIKGLDHESPAATVKGLSKKLRRAVPKAYASFATEPAFAWDDTTFCFWCARDGATWQSPPAMKGLVTGAEELLAVLTAGPEGYHHWAEEYYECEIDLGAVKRVFQHKKLDKKIVAALNPDVTIDEVVGDLDEIGYPR